MREKDFTYEHLIGIDGKSYMRITMRYDDKEFSEDIKIYWFGFVWGKPAAQIRILKQILKYIDYIEE